MRVTNEQATIEAVCQGKIWIACPSKCPMYGVDDCKSNRPEKHEYAADLLEARALIKELSDMMLEISQYSIASVCEEVRQKARNEWERARDFV